MSWTDIFPVLTDEQVDEYQTERTPGDALRFEEWFGVARVIPPRDRPADLRHRVSATLFWKNVSPSDPDLPVPSRRLLVNARRLGLVRRFAPWESYIAPLMLWSEETMARHPEVAFRIHLAADLEFLAPRLSELGWEIFLMKGSSLRYCPGGFWRFLALGEPGTIVTVIDTDRMAEASNDIRRTEMADSMGLALWRVPGYYNTEPKEHIRYRPILGGHFGGAGGIPVRSLIEAFVWHSFRGSIRKTAILPGTGEIPVRFTEWPGYGFDEWFQLAALYPRLAAGGVLTFIPKDARSMLLPVDLEYVQWANPRSESLFF